MKQADRIGARASIDIDAPAPRSFATCGAATAQPSTSRGRRRAGRDERARPARLLHRTGTTTRGAAACSAIASIPTPGSPAGDRTSRPRRAGARRPSRSTRWSSSFVWVTGPLRRGVRLARTGLRAEDVLSGRRPRGPPRPARPSTPSSDRGGRVPGRRGDAARRRADRRRSRIEGFSGEVGEEMRLRHRLPRPASQRMRAAMVELATGSTTRSASFLTGEGFLDIETHDALRARPQGARDFLVPSRTRNGLGFFALPQSPQTVQAAADGRGFERYFQIARCYRDEDLRTDRRPSSPSSTSRSVRREEGRDTT